VRSDLCELEFRGCTSLYSYMHALEWHMYKYRIVFQLILEPEALAIFSNNETPPLLSSISFLTLLSLGRTCLFKTVGRCSKLEDLSIFLRITIKPPALRAGHERFADMAMMPLSDEGSDGRYLSGDTISLSSFAVRHARMSTHTLAAMNWWQHQSQYQMF